MTAAETAAAAATFPRTSGRAKGYDADEVDAFLIRARAAFEGSGTPMTAADVRAVAFTLARQGYVVSAVDEALARIEDAFAAQERERAVSTSGVHAWVGTVKETAQTVLDRLSRPRGHRFDRVGMLRFGYRVDEVDVVADKLARYLETGENVTVDQVRSVAFRMQRGGYREVQVDAVLDAVVDVMLAVR
ncbi:DivIVA domain-containing protein [Microbacterium aureliae]